MASMLTSQVCQKIVDIDLSDAQNRCQKDPGKNIFAKLPRVKVRTGFAVLCYNSQGIRHNCSRRPFGNELDPLGIIEPDNFYEFNMGESFFIESWPQNIELGRLYGKCSKISNKKGRPRSDCF